MINVRIADPTARHHEAHSVQMPRRARMWKRDTVMAGLHYQPIIVGESHGRLNNSLAR